MNSGRFLAIVKKYAVIEKLTPAILNEFVKKIIVRASDKKYRETRAANGNQL